MKAQDFWELLEEVGATRNFSATLTGFFAFPLCVLYFLNSSTELARDPLFECKDVFHMSHQEDCDELRQMGVLNTGTISADHFLIMTLVLASVLGSAVGAGRWWWRHRNSDQKGSHLPLREPLLVGEELLAESAPLHPWFDWVAAVNDESLFARYLGLALGTIVSTPHAVRVALRILADGACQNESYLRLILSSPKDNQCTPKDIYPAMMPFCYIWATSTWFAYVLQELRIVTLLAERLYQKLFPRATPAQTRSWLSRNLMSESTETALKFHAGLWVKMLGLSTFWGALFSLLAEGMEFSNKVLKQDGCPSFRSVALSSKFLNSDTCPPVREILGMDAFVLRFEALHVYLLAVTLGLFALLSTASVSMPLLSRIAKKNKTCALVSTDHFPEGIEAIYIHSQAKLVYRDKLWQVPLEIKLDRKMREQFNAKFPSIKDGHPLSEAELWRITSIMGNASYNEQQAVLVQLDKSLSDLIAFGFKVAIPFALLVATYSFIFSAIPRADDYAKTQGCLNTNYLQYAYIPDKTCPPFVRQGANATFMSMMWVRTSIAFVLSLFATSIGHMVYHGAPKVKEKLMQSNCMKFFGAHEKHGNYRSLVDAKDAAGPEETPSTSTLKM